MTDLSLSRTGALSNTISPLNATLLTVMLTLAVLSVLTGQGLASVGDLAKLRSLSPDAFSAIFWQIRLPRTILAILVGASLALSGAALQGLLRNPLAAPEIVGASSGATLGAVTLFYFGWFGMSVILLPVGGMIGAVAALGLVYALAGARADMVTLILAGVAVNTIGAALTSLALNLAPSPFAIYEIVFWLLGSLTDRSLDYIWIVMAPLAMGWGLMFSAARGLDALTLGEEAAHTLGFSPGLLKAKVIFGAGLAVGASIAVAGSIGFVGLVVPHILRPFVGHRPGALLLPSALGGACLLLAADISVRLFSPGPEVKLGVVTAIVGAPFFLRLVWMQRRQANGTN